MRTYDSCALSDLETMVHKDMVRLGLDPQNQKDIKEFWENKLDEDRYLLSRPL